MGSNENQQSSTKYGLYRSTNYMAKFELYETCSNFYLIGREKKGTQCRILKISRLEFAELNIHETSRCLKHPYFPLQNKLCLDKTIPKDTTTYSEDDCNELLRRIHEGNKSTGGLKLVTNCYGIVGFFKFLGPYYMLIITKRRKIGAICGHPIYAITKSKMIPIPNSTLLSDLAYNKNENRYRKLICAVDLTKDFFFSYSYRIMFSLQKNECDNRIGRSLYETMFVWNEFLTRAIRNRLKNTLWTVALIYGFFKQVKFSLHGNDFVLTLIARRSRHFAGTRYLKRGVNEKGRVANDVETEQIIFIDAPEDNQMQVSSVVQNRGSIPLFWSQEASLLNIKPDIVLSKRDHDYTATRLHFENLVRRYGSPIIILNLIKSHEKKLRESLLRVEFANAIDIINKELPEENRLMFLHWDFHQQTRKKNVNILLLLGKVAEYALNLTGIFYCQLPSSSNPVALPYGPESECQHYAVSENSAANLENGCSGTDIFEVERKDSGSSNKYPVTPSMLQNGVLRTNCIDCLDRTNVAQYAYGLVALGRQLCALGVTDEPNIDIETTLASGLMRIYEMMGDTLALQYGGSPAHNKVFSQRRGQCRAATQSQELFRTLRRHYNNAYMDAEKQDAINLFLGHFQPQASKPALWELNSDQHYNIGRQGPSSGDDNIRPSFRRSLSDGNVLCDGRTPAMAAAKIQNQKASEQVPAERSQVHKQVVSESAPEISAPESDISYSRCHPSTSQGLFQGRHLSSDLTWLCESDAWNCSNFLDVDLLSSSGNSCEDDAEGISWLNTSISSLSCETRNDTKAGQDLPNTAGHIGMPPVFSHNFVEWVNNGGLLSY